MFEKYIELDSEIKSEIFNLNASAYIVELWVGVCQTIFPLFIFTAVTSPMALIKIIRLFFTINESFLIDFINESSVFTFQSLFPLVKEMQFKVLSRSTVNTCN